MKTSGVVAAALAAALWAGSAPAGLAEQGAAPSAAACGGDFGAWRAGVAAEARAAGMPEEAIRAVLAEARISDSVLARDRSQKAFKRTFLAFAKNVISTARLKKAAQLRARHAALFAEAEAAHGVPPEVLLAFWAMETNFGSFMGDFPVIASLATLAHDCRRPEIFRPQLLAAIGLYARGGLDLRETGAWAGEIGHVQMLPGDILKLGVDADGDGRVRMKASAEDALATAAAKLADRGWRRGEPWIVEVTTPEGFDWAQSGFGGERPGADWAALGVAARDAGAAQAGAALPAALLAPQGRKGPKFLVYPNFSEVYLAWNQSLVNTLSAAYLATRIGGAPRFLAGAPDPGLGLDAMKRLQERLQALGHDVGAVDGVLGARTRAAVRAEQARLGVPADGWPTPDLLARL